MENGKYTPGPWRAQHTAGHETHGQTAIYDDTGKDIAIVYDGDANAPLIEAAPDLLEALREASRALSLIDPLAAHHNATMIDNALAKARGAR